MNTVGITGATGFIGSALRRAFSVHGWNIVELGRSASEKGARFLPFELQGALSPELPADLDVLIHSAYRFGSRSMAEEQALNIEPSLRLFEKAKKQGCRFVFISSMAAFSEARSIYGRGKFAVEKAVLAQGGMVIRPGLITGDGKRGLVPAIAKFLRFSPLVPVIGRGDQILYTCDVARFAESMVHLCGSFSSLACDRPIVIARPAGKTLAQLLRLFAHEQRQKIFLVPIPACCLYAGLKMLEGLGLRLPFRSDSIVSLIHANPHPCADAQLIDPGGT